MEVSNKFDNELIAPCGVNCGACMAYLRAKNNVMVVMEMMNISRIIVLNVK